MEQLVYLGSLGRQELPVLPVHLAVKEFLAPLEQLGQKVQEDKLVERVLQVELVHVELWEHKVSLELMVQLDPRVPKELQA